MALKRKTSSPTMPIKKKTTEYGQLMDRIRPVTQLDLVLAALFYGRASTGKTTIACSFPGPILHLDIREKGTDSVTDVKDLDTINVEEWDEFEQIYWYIKSGESKYRTVIIDSCTPLQDLAVEKAMAEDGKTDGIVTKRQWGTASGYLKTWIINYRDLVDEGIHVVFLAHDRITEGDEGEEGELMPSVGPRLMPSVASLLTGAVKITGNTFIREAVKKLEGGKIERRVIYSMRLGPHAFYSTKVRQPKGSYVPDILDNPDYESLCQIMKGEFKKPEPPKAPTSVTKKVIKRRT